MASSQAKTLVKEKVTCVGCGKAFQVLLSHLNRTKDRENPCKDNYDMQALKTEATRVHRDQMAARKREVYHNDPEESSRKKDYYHRDNQKTSDWIF